MQSTPTKRTRRYHPPDLKRQVVAASQQPGASVAGLALTHRLNAGPGSPLDEGSVQGGGALTVTVAEPARFRVRADAHRQPESSGCDRRAHPTGTAPWCRRVSLQWPASAAASAAPGCATGFAGKWSSHDPHRRTVAGHCPLGHASWLRTRSPGAMVEVFGAARLHHAYIFANQRGTRMKVLSA